MIFWDTSALVRCYSTSEPGYDRARNLLLGDQNPYASVLILPEATSAIVRKLQPDRRRAISVLEVLDKNIDYFTLIPIDDALLESAVKIVRKHALRGADAIHLASAITLSRKLGRRQLRFATADLELAVAARAEELKVIEPA